MLFTILIMSIIYMFMTEFRRFVNKDQTIKVKNATINQEEIRQDELHKKEYCLEQFRKEQIWQKEFNVFYENRLPIFE